MKIAQRRYAKFHLTRCIMGAGESYFIPAPENDISIGVICIRGGTEHHPSVPAPAVHLPQAGEGLLLNDGDTAWSNEAVGHNDLTLYAPVDTEWLCIGENGHGRPGLDLVQVNGASRLAGGLGVIVVGGGITVDGIAGGPDAYFKPRQADVLMSGAGQAILVSWA
jgi:hypothetical protein